MGKNAQKRHCVRVAAIHDLSGMGRCSLTVALPILSAAGHEVCVIPTALLSTQTGDFTGYTFLDLTDEILKIVRHWQSTGAEFDAVYTGYLGNRQIDAVSKAVDILSEMGRGGGRAKPYILVDPVMADKGVMYSGFDADFPEKMRRLCDKADLITPNMTEACLLTGGGYGAVSAEELTRKLTTDRRAAVVTCGAESGEIPGNWHGSGDIFSSALLAFILSGYELSEAQTRAKTFTEAAIRETYELGGDPKFGIWFERRLPMLFNNQRA